MMKPLIQIKDLSFSYGNDNVLDQISFDIMNGDIFALMGRNGCGKTTLLNCLMGFNNISAGTIFIENEDVAKQSHTELSKKISYVPQHSTNNSTLNVFDYISLGRIVYKRLFEHLNSSDVETVKRYSSLLKIEHLLQKNMDEISGGEKQLAMIARALTQETPIIVFDEPTSALDFGNQSRFLEIIRDLSQNGKTVVFTTHNPNHVLALDSKVCILHQKQILCCGEAQKVINQDVITEVYGNNLEFVCDGNRKACTFSV